MIGPMPIPQLQSAFIEPAKLSGYLLNPAHPIGGPKARWFISLGYHPNKPDQLAADLLAIAKNAADCLEETSPYGVKYVVTGEVATPSGRFARIVTVWIVDIGQSSPRLVTAYPAEDPF
jgi:hypothetical protein